MNKTITGLALFATLTFAACGNPPANNEVSASQPISMPGSSPAQTQSQTAQPSTIVDMNKPATTNPQAGQSQAVQVQQPQPAAKSSGALNPEHGKPGHRCDIAVGAPLSSPVGATAQPQPQQFQAKPQPQPQMQVGPQITPIQSAPSPATGKGRINPAHGEPGHDCAKPVGAPLD